MSDQPNSAPVTRYSLFWDRTRNVLKEHPDGSYCQWKHYEALARERDELKADVDLYKSQSEKARADADRFQKQLLDILNDR